MNGFWDTWLHIGVGLACAAVIGGLVYAIHDIGVLHGRDEVWWTRYDRGYSAGYSQGYFDHGVGRKNDPRREGE